MFHVICCVQVCGVLCWLDRAQFGGVLTGRHGLATRLQAERLGSGVDGLPADPEVGIGSGSSLESPQSDDFTPVPIINICHKVSSI
jgi:hypothetical protein